MLKNRLIYKTTPGTYINDYDPTIDPSVINSHATAAFRYFHSQIEGRLEWVGAIHLSLIIYISVIIENLLYFYAVW